MGLGFEPWTEGWKAMTNPLATELWAFAPYIVVITWERAVSFFGLRKRVCYDSKKTWEKVSLKENLGVCKKRRERGECVSVGGCVCVCVWERERERESEFVGKSRFGRFEAGILTIKCLSLQLMHLGQILSTHRTINSLRLSDLSFNVTLTSSGPNVINKFLHSHADCCYKYCD